jgi:hypothetical protein
MFLLLLRRRTGCSIGWWKGNSGACSQCSSSGIVEAATAVIVFILFAVWIAFTTRESMSSSFASARLTDSSGAAKRRGALVKTLTTFAQCYGIARTLPIQWPLSIIEVAFDYANFVISGDGAVANDCIVSVAVSGVYQRFLAAAIVFPLASIPLVYGAWGAAFVLPRLCGATRSESWSQYRETRIPVTFTVVAFVLWPMISLRTLGLFACRTVSDEASLSYTSGWAPQSYLVANTFEKCYEGTHLLVVAIAGVPVLVLLCVGFPIGLVWFLRRHRNDLAKPKFSEKWGFLYTTYTRDHPYWEAVVMLRKMALSAFATFLTDSAPTTQAAALLFVFVVATFAEFYFAPVYEPVLARAERLSLLALTASFFGAVFLASNPNMSAPSTGAFSFAIVGLPLLLLAWFIVTVLREVVAIRVASTLSIPPGSALTSEELEKGLVPRMPRRWMRRVVHAALPRAEPEHVRPSGFELRPALCLKSGEPLLNRLLSPGRHILRARIDTVGSEPAPERGPVGRSSVVVPVRSARCTCAPPPPYGAGF